MLLDDIYTTRHLNPNVDIICLKFMLNPFCCILRLILLWCDSENPQSILPATLPTLPQAVESTVQRRSGWASSDSDRQSLEEIYQGLKQKRGGGLKALLQIQRQWTLRPRICQARSSDTKEKCQQTGK